MTSRFKVPHTLVLLVGMIVLAYLATFVLPQGEFETFVNDHGRDQVVPGTYGHLEEAVRLSPTTVFEVVPQGFARVADIIFFVFLVGGAFGVLRATGAVDALIGLLLPILGRRPLLFVAGTILLFAVGSSTIGMAEEYLPFVPILLALAIGLGFDALTGVAVLCVGYGVGYGAAAFNPFTVLLAQDVAGLPPTSGWQFRLAIGAAFAVVGIHHVWSYARRVREEPSESLVADVEPDPHWRVDTTASDGTANLADARVTRTALGVGILAAGAWFGWTWALGIAGLFASLIFLGWFLDRTTIRMDLVHVETLGVTAAAIALIVYGISELSGWGWYVAEMGAVFLGLSFLYVLVARLQPSKAAAAFCEGASELTTTALLIGFANSIVLVLEQGKIIHTIVNGVAQPLQALGPTLASVGMFFVQCLCNLFIPSGSGQAYVTMPIMTPLADLVGVSRQIAVLAYQFGDGFTNILVPTNAVLIGILTMARVPFDRWFRFVFPFMVKIWILGSVILAIAVAIGYA